MLATSTYPKSRKRFVTSGTTRTARLATATTTINSDVDGQLGPAPGQLEHRGDVLLDAVDAVAEVLGEQRDQQRAGGEAEQPQHVER